MRQKHIGIIAVFLSAVMWALEPLAAKLSYEQSTFLETSIIRAYVIILIAGIYIIIRKKKQLNKIRKQQLTALIYIAVIGTLIADLIYFYALVTTPILNAVLLGHLQPMFIILFAFIILKNETLNTRTYLGIGFMMLSAVFVSTRTLENAFSLTFGTFGDALVLVATIFWATTAITMRKYLLTLDSVSITFYRFFIASLIFTLILPFINNLTVNIYQIFVGIIVGIGTVCYYEGLKRLKAAEVSGIELSAPVFAAGIGFFLLNEPITILQVIGIIWLFIGVFLITSETTYIYKIIKAKKRSMK
jgi:drug/metabolite transporter (DMT)-like permease